MLKQWILTQFKETRMLVLSRKKNQAIVLEIGDQIVEVKVKQIRGNIVRLGLAAPQNIKILRKELKGDKND